VTLTADPQPTDTRPRLMRDPSFWGMNATQFLGAFNDNLFKQTVLLTCVDLARQLHSPDRYQPLAQAVFAAPFLLFSGIAGWLSDRLSKRSIVIACKGAELVIMLLGMGSLLMAIPQVAGATPETIRSGVAHPLFAALVVLFLLGTHSAFFGPPKYGILPQLVRSADLSRANGLFLMATFLAIILGTAGAGYLKGALSSVGWPAGLMFVAVAAAGVIASLQLRRTPPVNSGLRLRASDFLVNRQTFRLIVNDRPLWVALVMSSLFWFSGGVVQLAVNVLGKRHLFAAVGNLSGAELTAYADTRTSWLQGGLCLGIALGCMTAGMLSPRGPNFRLVTWGAWGISAGLAAIGALAISGATSTAACIAAGMVLFQLGFATGIFTVPLQVFLQNRPPVDQKGRVIGALNIANWIGILGASLFYELTANTAARISPGSPLVIAAPFAATACIFVPIAVWYRPKSSAGQTLS
jgi:acyl-[acyl-carrier-protein]-phospholipid O-acyltransferase/long-chain-fatty-acid--[acyl-carrier-protein] ligase